MSIYIMENEGKVCWLLENKIIFIQNPQSLDTWLIEADRQIISLLNQSSAPHVHLLSDFSKVKNTPNPQVLIENSQFLKHPHLGWMIPFQVESKVMRFVGLIATQIFKTRTRICRDFSEGLAFLHEATDLPPLDLATCKAILQQQGITFDDQ